jgi:hypothetical protein
MTLGYKCRTAPRSPSPSPSNYQRLSALKHLKMIHNEKEFRLTTINNYLLPIVCSFINDVITKCS